MVSKKTKPELLRFVYDDFKAKSEHATKIYQFVTDCQGNSWRLALYPDYPTVTLSNRGKHDLDVTISTILRDSKGCISHEQRRGLQHFKAGNGRSYIFLLEWSKIINRQDKILNAKKELVIEVEITHVKSDVLDCAASVSHLNSFGQNMILKLLGNEESADVLFEVQETHRYVAHRILLEANAPVLANFCEHADKDTAVPISNTSPIIFECILRYVYGGEVPSNDIIKKHVIELLKAADRFGVVGLKLAVESSIIRLGIVNVQNVVEFLLFSDCLTLGLLKEYTLSYFVTRAKDIFKTKSASRLKQSGKLSFEVIEAIINNEDTSQASDHDKYGMLSVEQLRRKLAKRGVLDLDGSKKMLVSRLREQQRIKQAACSN